MSKKTLDNWVSKANGDNNKTTVQLTKETLKKLQDFKIRYGARSYEEVINILVSIAVNNAPKDSIKEKLCGEYLGLKTGPYPPKGWITIFLKTGVLEENSDGTYSLTKQFCEGYIPGEGSET